MMVLWYVAIFSCCYYIVRQTCLSGLCIASLLLCMCRSVSEAERTSGDFVEFRSTNVSTPTHTPFRTHSHVPFY